MCIAGYFLNFKLECARVGLKRVLFKVLILFHMSPNHKIAQKFKVSKIRHYLLSTSSEVTIHISKPNVNMPAMTRPCMRTPPGKVNIPFRDLIVASVHFHVFCPGYLQSSIIIIVIP